MDNDKVICVITNADVNYESGNMTLVLRRAEAIYIEYGIKTIIISYNYPRYVEKNKGDYYYKIIRAENKSKLYNILSGLNLSLVILYGTKTALLSYSLKSFFRKNNKNVKVMMDIQGAIEEKWEYANTVKNKIKYPLHYLAFLYGINNSDGAFVVSEELMCNCKRKLLRNKNNFIFNKIRCGVVEYKRANELLQIKQEMRKNYGFSDDTIIFAYSGYRMAWQKIDEIIELFRKFDSRINDAFFMFFCNTDENFEQQLKKAFPKNNYKVKLLSKEEYENTLCMCDVGMIVRDYNETNKVAFPNKFSDYLSCGLLLGMNAALPEPMRIIKKYGLSYLDVDDEKMDGYIDTIVNYKRNLQMYLSITSMVCEKELSYKAQVKNIIVK